MPDIKVSFPSPCSEPWEGMTPSGCHRHCASCDKVIHDLAAMTFDEVQGLVERGEEACVRARIASDGTIALAGSKKRRGRRLVAAMGASITLAAAACQTPIVGPVSPRFTVTGESSWYYTQKMRLIAANGEMFKPALGKGNILRFNNLKPGTYTPQFTDSCGIKYLGEPVTVTDQDVNVGEFRWESGCIIVGLMMPADEGRRG